MKKTLLILDLYETLIFSTETPLSRASDLTVDVYAIYYRPYNMDRILMVDDDSQKVERNYGNHIQTAPYTRAFDKIN